MSEPKPCPNCGAIATEDWQPARRQFYRCGSFGYDGQLSYKTSLCVVTRERDDLKDKLSPLIEERDELRQQLDQVIIEHEKISKIAKEAIDDTLRLDAEVKKFANYLIESKELYNQAKAELSALKGESR